MMPMNLMGIERDSLAPVQSSSLTVARLFRLPSFEGIRSYLTLPQWGYRSIAFWPVSVVRRSLTEVKPPIRDDSVSICFEQSL